MANPSDNADAPDMPLSSLSALPTTQPITNNKLPISSNVMTQKNVDVDTFISKISDADSYLQSVYLTLFAYKQDDVTNGTKYKKPKPILEGGAESFTHNSRNRQTLKRPSTSTSLKPTLFLIIGNDRHAIDTKSKLRELREIVDTLVNSPVPMHQPVRVVIDGMVHDFDTKSKLQILIKNIDYNLSEMDRTDRQINHQIRMKMELITVLQERIKSMRNSGYGKKNAEEILSGNQKIEKETNDVRELKKLLSNERNVGVNVDVIDSKKNNERQVSGQVLRQIDLK